MHPRHACGRRVLKKSCRKTRAFGHSRKVHVPPNAQVCEPAFCLDFRRKKLLYSVCSYTGRCINVFHRIVLGPQTHRRLKRSVFRYRILSADKLVSPSPFFHSVSTICSSRMQQSICIVIPLSTTYGNKYSFSITQPSRTAKSHRITIIAIVVVIPSNNKNYYCSNRFALASLVYKNVYTYEVARLITLV